MNMQLADENLPFRNGLSNIQIARLVCAAWHSESDGVSHG